MENRPCLPQKLPSDARKKLSISNLSDHATQAPIDDENENDYTNYLSPFDPPTNSAVVISANDDSDSDHQQPELEFFNDSIYFRFDPDAELEGYSSLRMFTSSNVSKQTKSRGFFRKISSCDSAARAEPFLIELDDSQAPKPTIPPKRKLSDQFKKLSLANCSFNESMGNKFSIADDELATYLQPTDKKAFTFDEFRSSVFSKRENRMCADCKFSQELPKWVSCVYMMFYCDDCAEVHLKLSHAIRPFYMIELEQLFQTLNESEFFCDIPAFVYMVTEQAGNDKINSLLEFSLDESSQNYGLEEHDFEQWSRDKFIRDKYLGKKFLATPCTEPLDELNRRLVSYCVAGPCLPITILNVFMGGNVNAVAPNRRSALDNSIDFGQKFQSIYLRLQGARTYHDIGAGLVEPDEFVGELNQVIDLSNRSLSRSRILLKLCRDNQLRMVYLNRQSQTIALNSIVRVADVHEDESLLEIRWQTAPSSTAAILSTYLEFFDTAEKHLWSRHLCAKMSDRALDPTQDALRIREMNFLHEERFDRSLHKCLLVLFESKSTKRITIFDRQSKLDLDVRKLVRIRLDETGLLVLDVLPTRSLRFQTPFAAQLAHRLKEFASLRFRNMDEQLLNKDDCPLVVDKLCSFVEIYHLTERGFYSHSGTLELKNRLKPLFARLESERDFTLDAKLVSPSMILGFFRIYFAKYFQRRELELVRSRQLKSSRVLFTTMKRLTAHLVLVARYEASNQHSIAYLARLFGQLMSDAADNDNLSLDFYLTNYEQVFGLGEDYFTLQANIIDKLAAIKAGSSKSMRKSMTTTGVESRLLGAGYLTKVYWMCKTSEKFIQIGIAPSTRARDVLERAVAEFATPQGGGAELTANLSLFEVADQQVCHLSSEPVSDSVAGCLLERALPIGSPLSSICHDWCKFNLVVKANYFSGYSSGCSASFHDACFSISLSSNNLSAIKHPSGQEGAKKWRSSYLSVQNACIRICERSTKCEDTDHWSLADSKKIFEAKIEDCLVYYGLYEVSAEPANDSVETTAGSSSSSRPSSFIKRLLNTQQTGHSTVNKVNRENCLTIYHLVDKSIHSVCLESRQNALHRYACLFKLSHYPETWSLA